MTRTARTLVCLTSLWLMAGASGPAMGEAKDPGRPHLAPRPSQNKALVQDDHGFIPPDIDTAHYAANVAAGLVRDKALPASYDCRPLGYVTPVKNQGPCGACYAFSSAADVESRLLMGGDGTYDLSENAMKECHYQDSSCSGGNQQRIMNYLTSTGAALESCDPYVASDVGCALGCDAEVVVLDWREISGNSVPPTDVLKQYMLDNGPIHTTLFAGDAGASAWQTTFGTYNGTGTLYYAGTQTPNHSVVLVGWDDSLVHAGGTGAWIVKNSWGTGWGGNCGYGSEGGYFKIAFGSASIGKWSSYTAEYMFKNPQMDLLQNDEGGYSASWGGIGTSLWALARHDVPTDTYLHRVEFWTNDVTTDVDVYIYDSFTGGVLGNLLDSSLNHSFAEPGYNHVELAAPLSLDVGQDIYIAVRFTNQSYNYPVTLDMDGPAANNRSYYSINGLSWTSLYGNGADVTVRARTSADLVLALEDPGTDPGTEDVPVPHQVRLYEAYPNPFNPNTNITYALPHEGHVEMAVFDLQGRKVRTLVSGRQDAGDHRVVWDGKDQDGVNVPSGVYFCRVDAFDQSLGIKLALLK